MFLFSDVLYLKSSRPVLTQKTFFRKKAKLLHTRMINPMMAQVHDDYHAKQ